jgi:Sec-independent protein translocase protein TatA
VSLLLLALLLFLLFGGSRVNAAGKGLGEAVRHVKRAVGNSADDALGSASSASPIMTVSSVPVGKEPKLLPAKGESSASAVDAGVPAARRPGDGET